MKVALGYDSTGDASDALYKLITDTVSKRMDFVDKAADLLPSYETATEEEADKRAKANVLRIAAISHVVDVFETVRLTLVAEAFLHQDTYRKATGK